MTYTNEELEALGLQPVESPPPKLRAGGIPRAVTVAEWCRKHPGQWVVYEESDRREIGNRVSKDKKYAPDVTFTSRRRDGITRCYACFQPEADQ